MSHRIGGIGDFSLLSNLVSHFGESLCQPFRLPILRNERVEVEPIACEYVPKFDPSEPLLFTDDFGRSYRKVIGYRELYLKRNRIFYLNLLAEDAKSNELSSDKCFCTDDLAPGGIWGNKTNEGTANRGISVNNNSTNASTANRRQLSDFPTVAPWRDKCEIEQEFHEPKQEFKEVYEIRQERQKAIDAGKTIVRQLSMGSHYMVLFRGHQMDSEWLQLSASTDPEVEEEKARRKEIMPTFEPWMDKGLNYGSQKLFRALSFFIFLLTLTFRNPFTFQPCYRNKIMMVHVFRKRMFIYSIPTLFLWLVLCFIVINVIDLKYRTKATDQYKSWEYREMELYYIPLIGFFINLFLAALWSLLVLIHYSLVIANYYNLWSKAMPFLDLNPAFGLASYVKVHLLCYILYVCLWTASFVYDWPLVTRETCGQIFVLTFRQMFPRVRYLDPKYYLWGQIGAFVVYMYCVWVNRTLFMFMHTFSIILKNACQQWNLNFALRFQLIPTYYRAHLLRIATQSSLLRLYNQHRIIAALCEYYGKTFVHPLFIYGVVNVALLTIIMIYYIKYEEADPAAFNYTFTRNLKGKSKAVIYHTLPKSHEVTAVFFVMLQSFIDFVQGTIGIDWGAKAITLSFEFVRRHGLLQCNTRHERRLIHSLYMSFADVRAPLLTAQRYFGITKRNVFGGMMAMAFFWTMIIQCQVEQPSVLIEYVNNNTGRCEGLRLYQDILGGSYCMHGHKYRMKIKQRLLRKRNEIVKKLKLKADKKTKYWFFEDCELDDIIDAQARMEDKGFGICQVTFSTTQDADKISSKFPRHISTHELFEQYHGRWSRSVEEWVPPTGHQYHTPSIFPCDTQVPLFTWKEFYRDFYRPCYSVALNKYVMLPVLFHKNVGRHGKAEVYSVDLNNYGNVDCGVNPFTQEEVSKLFDCSGRPTGLDDCGSPRSPTFIVNTNKGSGIFLPEPPLKYFSFPLPSLPPNYKQAGFAEAGVLRCWDTFTAIQRCTDPNLRQYCRLAGKRGKANEKGYLYGKDCYDFQHFAVFVPPNAFLFCLHPRAELDIKKPMWIDEEFYKNQMKKREAVLTSINNATGSGRAIHSIMLYLLRQTSSRPSTTTQKPKSKPAPEIEHIHLRGRRKPVENVRYRGRAALPKKQSLAHRLVQKTIALGGKSRNVLYAQGSSVSRKSLFFKYFPCFNAEAIVVGWLPIPTVINSAGTDALDEATLEKARGGMDCWSNPYPREVFGTGVISVYDHLGYKFLDDCLNPWWSDDIEVFIPDDVFNPPPVPQVEVGDFLCWETPRAMMECDTLTKDSNNAKCFHLN